MSYKLKIFIPILAAILVVGAGVFLKKGSSSEEVTPLEEVISSQEEIIVDVSDSADKDVPKERTARPTIKFSRESTLVEASSELKDDTGYGFAYSPANVLDLDYSTAWCPDASDSSPWLKLTFSEKIPFSKLDTIGIVPGFARDEKIYFQNNRIKTLLVGDGTPEGVVVEYPLEDTYAMHFLDLSTQNGEADSLILKVGDVYPGSKYKDTCIAEVDFWSDWVTTRDAQAAVNYYEQYKKASAVRPVRVSSVQFSLPFTLEACGRLDLSMFKKTPFDNGMSYYWTPGNKSYSYKVQDGVTRYSFEAGDKLALSATLNESARAEDIFLVKLISKSWFSDRGEETSLQTKVWYTDTVKATGCDDGKLYLSHKIEDMPMGCFFGTCFAEFYFNDRLVGRSPVYSLLQ